MPVKCNDCANCSSRDVFNGYCEVKEKSVLIDTLADGCKKFAPAKKCKFCKNYSASEKDAFLGFCENVMVYPDLGGCEKFEAGGKGVCCFTGSAGACG